MALVNNPNLFPGVGMSRLSAGEQPRPGMVGNELHIVALARGDGHGIDLDRLGEAFTPRTRAIPVPVIT